MSPSDEGADQQRHAHAADEEEERRRLAGNEVAWRNLHGYRTSSGIPCYDEGTRCPVVPKHSGFGLNPNFYACVWCCVRRRQRS